MVLTLSLWATLGCSGGEEDSSDLPWGPFGDSGWNEDSTTDTGSGTVGLDSSLLAPPANLWQAASFTLPPDRGWAWEYDASFSIDQRSRPQLYIRNDGVYVMIVGLASEGKSRFAMTSDNGDAWDRSTIPFVEPELFAPLNCGSQLDDAFVAYQTDGTYAMVVEGAYDPELDGDPEWRQWCRATSDDGETFWPDVDGYVFSGGEADGGHPADAGTVQLSDYSVLAYYDSRATDNAGGVRAALSGVSAASFETLDVGDVLNAPAVEATPVYLEGGGLRVYYTRNDDGGIGVADLLDGVNPSGDALALANAGADCSALYAECYRDPVVLRLPDDRLVLYFTRVMLENDGYSYAIQRAWATD